MALSTTTLSAAIGPSTLTIPVTSTTGFAINQPVMIDGEVMFVSGPITSTTVKVRWRGTEGTAAVAHDVQAPVTTGLPSDFPAIAPGLTSIQPASDDAVLTIGQDQTVTLPNENAVYYINKPGVCNITLAGATAAQIGVEVKINSNTAFAHVLTYAPGFFGGANTVCTFVAKIGASVTLQVGPGGLISAIGSLDQVTFSL